MTTGHDTTTTPAPQGPQGSPAIILLADVLAQAKEIPTTRIGRVLSIDKSTSVWMVVVSVEGGASSRRCRWLGSGSQPQVGELIVYLNESPIPTVMGRVSNNNESQQFGGGAVSAGTYNDGGGNLRTGIDGAVNDAVYAQGQAVVAQSIGNNAQGSANTAQSIGNNAQSSANNASGSASNAQNTANNAQNAANSAQNQANNALAVAQGNIGSINYLQTQVNDLYNRVNNLTAYANSLENTLISYLGPGGPDD